MALRLPKYIEAANIQDRTIRYHWDDWNVEAVEQPRDENFYARLLGLSQRANLAFATAVAEWIVRRFEGLSPNPLPLQYVEASWAQIVHWRYRRLTWEGDTRKEDWSGPVKRPIWRGMLKLEFAAYDAEIDESPAAVGSSMTNVAQHVLTDSGPYLRWRERVMERLEALYPLNPEERLGDVVPREALDPDFDFRLEQTEQLVNGFLSGLEYESNPFLNSPEQMVKEGFEGTPYVFNIERERRARFEW